MVIERREAPTLSDSQKQALLQGIADRDSRIYPPDWDFYEQVVAANPADPWVCIPHKQTGESTKINLFTDTVDDIMIKCGFPEHQREPTLRFYRSHLLSRIPYWDENQVPDRIPLLEE